MLWCRSNATPIYSISNLCHLSHVNLLIYCNISAAARCNENKPGREE